MAAPAAERPLDVQHPTGYYSNVDANPPPRHVSVGELEIYASQFNIGRELANRADIHVLPLHQRGANQLPVRSQPIQFDHLNFLLAGPTFVELREQLQTTSPSSFFIGGHSSITSIPAPKQRKRSLTSTCST